MTDECQDSSCLGCRFRVLVCGSREWVAPFPIWRELQTLLLAEPNLLVIHGGARGADRLSGQAAASLGIPVIEVPAEWERYGRGAGMIRNQRLLEMSPHLVLAFHENVDASMGTRDMIRRARETGIETQVFMS